MQKDFRTATIQAYETIVPIVSKKGFTFTYEEDESVIFLNLSLTKFLNFIWVGLLHTVVLCNIQTCCPN